MKTSTGLRRLPLGRRVLTVALVAALGGSLVAVTPAAASSPVSSLHPGRPAPPSVASVPVQPVAARPLPATRAVTRSIPRPVWPSAGSVVLGRTKAGTVPDGSPGVRAGQLPVWVGTTARSLAVQVMDQAATAATGVQGLLLSVSAADAGQAQGQVPVSVDYSAFATAHGADWSSRLRLVQLPACALTSPHRAACQTQAPLAGSRNDYQHQTVSAGVDVPAAGRTVLAVAAGPSGPLGSYQATSLAASSTWQAGLQTGDFVWSYPIEVPPGLGALKPSIAISYDSGSVDGLTAAGNDQASGVGDGFAYEPGFVERKYRACADEGKKTGDLCWGNDNATVLLNGQASELVRDDSSGVWHLKSDDGSRVDHIGSPGQGGEHWKITTPDGTQYFFGLNQLPGWSSGKPQTNSVWTVPVYGLHSGDPCNGGAGWCYQPYRWNLDLVIDPHSTVETFWYQTETNNYARDYNPPASNGTRTSYDRAGELLRIEYGNRATNGYAPTPMQVEFKVSDRCGPNSQTRVSCSDIKQDVPMDLSCTSGSCSNNLSPSFWTAKELDSIVTEVRQGSGYSAVDTYSLQHEFKDTGSGSFALTLDTITRKGNVGGSAALPPVGFGYKSLINRVDLAHLPAFNRNRLSTVSTESGSVITVSYSGPGCTSSTEPAPDSNTSLCFPQWWDGWPPPPNGNKNPDWFTKYAVTDVAVHDTTGGSPDEAYHFDYSGGGAWHYDEDNGLVKDSNKTWAQWRGFQKVVVTSGAPGTTQSESSHLFMRAMNKDRTASGGTKTVTVTDSQNTSIPDDPGLQGFEREQITYNGLGGAEVSAQVDDQLNDQTARAAHSWGTVTANRVNVASSKGRTALDGGRGTMQTRVDNTYDGYGILKQSSDQGDVAQPTPRCTTYSYARDTGAYLLTYPSEVLITATACGDGRPADPHLIVSDVRTSYDGQGWASPPLAGGANPTRIEKLSSGGSSPSFVTVATNTYDQYGRLTSTADALNRKTVTTFSPASGAAVTQSTIQDAAGNTSTVNLDALRGEPVQKIDVNGRSTTLAYDALGRLTSVWLPGQNPSAAKANATYAYTISSSSASSVKSSLLLPNGLAYSVSYQIYDGQLRPRQTQSPDQSGGNHGVISDTFYDSRGLVTKTNSTYIGSSPPSGSLVTPGLDTNIPGQTLNVYDGAGRETAQILRAYGVEQWRTTTSHGGDRTTVTPPGGGTATTTIKDARGQTVQLCQYHNLSPSGNCDAGSSDGTFYTYYPNGLLAGVADSVGNRWSYDYDARGRKVAGSDPDTGTTVYGYDDGDQMTSSRDARGQTLSYAYDALGHETQEWSGAVGSGAQLAAWAYNSSGSNLEQLASSTRFVGGNAYTTTVTGYDNQYRPTGVTISIPNSEGQLGGTYSFGYSYNVDGSLATETYPQAGGLNSERVVHTYDGVTGLPVKTGGQADYVEESTYTVFGQLLLLGLGTRSGSRWTFMQHLYDLPTKRLNQTRVSRDVNPNGFDANVQYRYDPAGNVLGAADTPTSGAADVQCFQYDSKQRLTDAWAQGTAGCATAPSAGIVGGPAPYWDHLGYDVTGNRTSETITYAPGNTVSYANGYPAPGQSQPHTLTSQNVTSTAYGFWTDTRSYDGAGNTQTVRTPHSSQTLSWNETGELANVVDSTNHHSSTYVYDADGRLLVRHDDSAATLELPGEELSLSGGQVVATRYYTHGGAIVAVRTPSGLNWLLADPHGTDTITVDANSSALTQRRFMPFGTERGLAPPPWPSDHGFVGGIDDSTTGLTTLGARQYDSVNGRFLSADPVLDTADPQQMNGYAYANNNPTTDSDPSGLMIVAGGGGGCVGSVQYCEARFGGGSRTPTYQSGRPMWMSGTTWMMLSGPPPMPRPSPPHPARPKPAPATTPSCGFGGRAGFDLGCRPAMSHTSGGGSILGFLKKVGGFLYHASGAADVVGCITHPSWGGCASALAAVALTAGTFGEGLALRMALKGGMGLVARLAAARMAASEFADSATAAVESLPIARGVLATAYRLPDWRGGPFIKRLLTRQPMSVEPTVITAGDTAVMVLLHVYRSLAH